MKDRSRSMRIVPETTAQSVDPHTAEDLLNAMGDGYVELDSKFVIRKVNRLFEKNAGISRRESFGKNFWELFVGFSGPDYPFWREYNQVMESRQPSSFEVENKLNHEWREVNVYPRVEGGIVIFYRDITARKLAEAELQRQHSLIQAITDHLPVALFLLGSDRRISYVNPMAERVTGYAIEESLGKSVHELIHYQRPDGTPYSEADCRVENLMTDGSPATVRESIFFRKDGTPFIAIANAVRLRDETGQEQILIDLRDTTAEKLLLDDYKEAKRRSQELRKITRTLKKQQKDLLALNAAKDEFISLASHQLRTPATAVKQYLGMMLQGFAGDVPGPVGQLAAKAYEANDRQIMIIEDLLRVARLESGMVRLNAQQFDLVRLAQEVIGEYAAAAVSHGLLVSLEHDRPAIVTTGDENLLRMAIENLLDNAIKYGDTGKRVFVRLRHDPSGEHIDIVDEGSGIAASEQAKLFKKFSRLQSDTSVATPGSGLGLYWARKIVNLHGGDIGVTSAPGKGSTFSVTLPPN